MLKYLQVFYKLWYYSIYLFSNDSVIKIRSKKVGIFVNFYLSVKIFIRLAPWSSHGGLGFAIISFIPESTFGNNFKEWILFL